MTSDWTKYRHGYWRRVGDTIECRAIGARTLPAGIIPAEPATIISADIQGVMHYSIRVRVRGWKANTVYVCDGRRCQDPNCPRC